jgi:hypothetical protein
MMQKEIKEKKEEMAVADELVCPFCGTVMEKCEPYLGNSEALYHPEAECWFSKNMAYHPELYRLWAKREERKDNYYKTIREVIIEHVKSVGGDGLCNPGETCGCGIDRLNLCEYMNIDDCQPARLTLCAECELAEDCTYKDEADGQCFLMVQPDSIGRKHEG